MIAVITYIELKNPFKFFALSSNAMGIVKQIQKAEGCKVYKSTGFWTKHFTMSFWESEEHMKAFAYSGNHQKAMKISGKIAKEIRTYTYQTETLPDWKKAKELVMSGKVLSYN